MKAKLAEEGLFAPERKRPIPTMPAVVGVITSPTGAVIRDILHRIRERWPCRVIVWPVVVQGDAAAAQVAAAIQGFAGLPAQGPLPRPHLLIVARGGRFGGGPVGVQRRGVGPRWWPPVRCR